MSTKAYAKISLQVEVRLSQPWGENSTIKHVLETGAREGRKIVQNIIDTEAKGSVSITGKPVVTAIVVNEGD